MRFLENQPLFSGHMLSAAGLKGLSQNQNKKITEILNIPLTAGILPAKGTAPETYNRDTSGTVIDFEGVVHTCGLDEIRIQGARRVENLLENSRDMTNLSWVKSQSPILTSTTFLGTASGSKIYDGIVTEDGVYYIFSFYASVEPGGNTTGYKFYHLNSESGSSTDLELTEDYQRYQVKILGQSGGGAVLFGFRDNNSSNWALVTITDFQVEKVTGTQTEASEVVSNGDLSSPYYGAGVDCVQYFNTDRDGNLLDTIDGVLIEDESTNQNPYSSILDYWSIAAASIDGNSINTVNSTNPHYAFAGGNNGSYESGKQYTFKYRFTYVNHRYVQLTGPSAVFGAAAYANFDLYGDGDYTVAGGTASIKKENGLYICTFTATATATGNASTNIVVLVSSLSASRLESWSATGDESVQVDFSQLEGGSYASSDILTDGTSVTRTEDQLSYDVSSIITQGQGGLYCEFIGNSLGSDFHYVLSLSDGTVNSRIVFYFTGASATFAMKIVNDGVEQSLITTSSDFIETEVTYKVCCSYEDNNIALYVNGELIGTDDSAVIPTVFTTLDIGKRPDGIAQLNGTIKDIRYFNKPLNTADMVRRTA